MCRAVAVGGGDLPNEGEIGRRQQCEGEGRGGWKTNEYRFSNSISRFKSFFNNDTKNLKKNEETANELAYRHRPCHRRQHHGSVKSS